MAGRSPHQIQLSAAEEAELRSRAGQYTLPYREVVRAKIVLLAAEGLANTEIAERLDTTREAVGRWRKRFGEERLAGLEERARPGRPGVFPP
jgi:transposase